MLTVSYTITGAVEVQRDLARLRLDALKGDIADILDDIAADAAQYPAQPSDSRYQRTNNLRDGWLDSQPVFDTDQDSLLAVLANHVGYGPFVQGIEDQATIHAGRWRTTDAIMDAWEGRVAERVEDALGRLIGA